jgi:hypothetical protein
MPLGPFEREVLRRLAVSRNADSHVYCHRRRRKNLAGALMSRLA